MGHWANMGNKTHVYEMNMKHIKHTHIIKSIRKDIVVLHS